MSGHTYSCSLTNTTAPTVTLNTVSAGNTNTFNEVQWQNRISNACGTMSATTTTAGTAKTMTSAACPTGKMTVSSVLNGSGWSEATPAGWQVTGFSCVNNTTGGTTVSGTLINNNNTSSATNVDIGQTVYQWVPPNGFVAGNDYTCTITNGTAPTVTVSQLTTNGDGTGAFSLAQWQNNLNVACGTLSANTTSGTAVTMTSTTCPTGLMTVGSVYNLSGWSETPPAGWQLTGFTCQDNANPGVNLTGPVLNTTGGSTATTVPIGAIGYQYVPVGTFVSGHTYACSLTSALSASTVTIKKVSLGGTGTFTLNQWGNTSSSCGNETATTTTAGTSQLMSSTACSTGANLVSNVAAVTGWQETPPTGWQVTGFSCSDNATPGTPLAGVGFNNTGSTTTPSASDLAQNTYLYIPANSMVATHEYTCTLTNTIGPVVKLTKTSTGGTGTFSNTQWENNILNACGTLSATTTASGTAKAMTSTACPTNGAMTVSSVLNPSGWSEPALANWQATAFSCQDDANPGVAISGPLLTNSYNTLTPTNVLINQTAYEYVPGSTFVSGHSYTCNITNATAPTVTITKTSLGGTGSFTLNQWTNTNSGCGNETATTATAGTGQLMSSTACSTGTNTVNDVTVATGWEETPPAGWQVTGFSCADNATPGTPLAGVGFNNTGSTTTASYSGPSQLTYLYIPSNKLLSGHAYSCSLTNSTTATVTIKKSAWEVPVALP